MSDEPPVFNEPKHIKKLETSIQRRDARVHSEIAAWEKRPQRVTALRRSVGLAILVAVGGGLASCLAWHGSDRVAGVALAVAVAAMLLQVRTESRESWNESVRQRAEQMMRCALVRMSNSPPISGRVAISLELESDLDVAAAYQLLGDHLRGASSIEIKIVDGDERRCAFSAKDGTLPIRV